MNFHTRKLSTILSSLFNFSTLKEYWSRENDPNLETICVYNNEYRHYIENTPTKYPDSYSPMLEWMKSSLRNIPKGGNVLEIGSATPRDANFIRQLGHQVQCSDATLNFVKYMNAQGEPAILLNILKDKIQKKYDLIFANAVFPHFTDKEIHVALTNAKNALTDHGIICFNVKQGRGEAWIKEKNISRRYINYQQPDNIKKIVQQNGFKILLFEEGCMGDPPTHVWIRVTAQKIS